ncbi:MAG: hypothetical protein A2X29_04920 [Elusimicrobia bacterium GWA2_64_40]|nr:MAG: hypothetical protein A2X29_04920 [Elusimicrobia bacterium GWA2_64_40]
MEEFEQFKRALEARDFNALKKVRKTDLHAHAYLSAGMETYQEISPEIALPPSRFDGFGGFREWLEKNCALIERAGYEKVISAAFQRMADDGIIYVEMSFDYHDCLSMGLEIPDWARLIQTQYEPYRARFALCPEFGISREERPTVSQRYLEEAAETGMFRSIDLYGDELCRPASEFRNIYDLASSFGMKKKAHLGEFGQAADIKDGVEILGLDAVQHGVSAADNLDVMSFLRDRGTTLNICPSSNLALGRYRSLSEHPIRRLFDHGVKLTLNSDDYMVFGAGVTDEITRLHESGIFSAKELWQIVRAGLAASEGRS